MSKITRHEVGILQRDELLKRIEQREAEFAELVEAAVAWYRLIPDPRYRANEVKVLHKAIQPFLPPPSPADRLDAFKQENTIKNSLNWYVLEAIAAELREGEK